MNSPAATPVPGLTRSSLLRERCLVAGAWIAADSGATIEVRNPADGTLLGTVPRCGKAETARAIAAAEQAWPGWRRRTAKERSSALRRWYEALIKNGEDLARLMTAEQGKPLAEARGEITYAASYIEWFAEETKRVYGDIVAGPSPDRRILVTREPVGVCAAITPWNFPAAMITRKAAAALAAGCTMVIKPASQTPFTALALAALAEEAGIPVGVLSVITGSAAEIGGELTRNPLVRKLSFTGSTEVGRTLAQQSAPGLKKLSLELGGNAPFIVFDDADLDAAVEGALASKFRNTGQTCVCANRFFVQRAVYDDFAARLAAAIRRLKVGNGFAEGVTQGPLIDAAAVLKVEEHIADALSQGAAIVCGGQRHSLGGSFFEPTLLTGATTAMQLAREETFGPLAALIPFDSESQVIGMANATEFGLAAYLYSRDLGRVMRVAEALECGMVGANTGLISNEMAPFGGVKQSGYGREGSRHGMDDYLVMKYLCLGGIGAADSGVAR